MIHVKTDTGVRDLTVMHWVKDGAIEKEISYVWKVVSGEAKLIWQAMVRKLLNTSKIENKTYFKNE